jgi:hypothetical protein
MGTMTRTPRTEIPTRIVECACEYCRHYADRKGLALPLRAEVNLKMADAICGTAKGRHSMVQKAYQPPFGQMDDLQVAFGPWVA